MSRKYRHHFANMYETADEKGRQMQRVPQKNSIISIVAEKQIQWRGSSPTIHWQGCRGEEAILNLSIHGKYVRSDTLFQRQMAEELSALLCCLFSQAQEILVQPLSHGFSNTRVVKVQPFYREGGAGQVVVMKFGDTQIIQKEYEHYRKYVQHFVGDGRSTTILDYQCTAHISGIVYSFLGTATNHMQSFGAFYHQASIDTIRLTLDWLFRSTCRIWYANHHALQFLNLTEEYQRNWSYPMVQLKRVVRERLPEVMDQEKLLFPSFHGKRMRSLLNPFSALKTMRPQIYPTYRSTIHGDFNACNIFVDKTGYPWLIDFQSTGPGHILRDVATLDAVIRFQLLTSEQATLDECLALEEALCCITDFDHLEQFKNGYSTANPALAKVWETIVHLRTIAHWLIEKKPSHEMSEYYAALFYVTMNTLSFSSLEVEQCEHALISASLLRDLL